MGIQTAKEPGIGKPKPRATSKLTNASKNETATNAAKTIDLVTVTVPIIILRSNQEQRT